MFLFKGVGQDIAAELELKKYYPKCNFLALDPVADVNAELVEKQLNGTFIERVITAEDSYTANLKLNTIWNSQGRKFFLVYFIANVRIIVKIKQPEPVA